MRKIYKERAIRFAVAVLSVLVLISGCGCKDKNLSPGKEKTSKSATIVEKESSQQDSTTFIESVTTVVIGGNLTVVTASTIPDIPAGILAIVNATDNTPLSPGNIVTLEVTGEVSRESENVISFGYNNAEIKDEEVGVLNIDFNTVFSILDKLPESAHLIDVRTAEEFESGHIEGALNIPLGSVEEGVSKLTGDMHDVILLYCRSGNRSGQAANLLNNAGYKLVFNAGGISSFKGELVYGK